MIYRQDQDDEVYGNGNFGSMLLGLGGEIYWESDLGKIKQRINQSTYEENICNHTYYFDIGMF